MTVKAHSFTSEQDAEEFADARFGYLLCHGGRPMIAQSYNSDCTPRTPEEWFIYEAIKEAGQ